MFPKLLQRETKLMLYLMVIILRETHYGMSGHKAVKYCFYQ